MKKLATKYTNHGGSVTAPQHIEYPAYNFEGWDRDLSNIIANTNICTIYTAKTYNVTFKYNNVQQGDVQVVSYGGKAVYNGPPLVKEGYNFVWTDIDKPIYLDTIITGDYYLVDGYYYVKFYDASGSEITTARLLVLSGNSATPPDNPIKDGYIFIGWEPSYTNILRNTDCYPQYQEEKRTLVIGGYKADGTNITDEYDIKDIPQPLVMLEQTPRTEWFIHPFAYDMSDTLTSIIDTSNQLTSIGGFAFPYLNHLRKEIFKFNTVILNGVKIIGSLAFSGCKYIEHLEINNVEGIDSTAFMLSTNKGKQDINLILPKLKYIGAKGFKNCKNIKILSADVLDTIGETAFNNCEDLEKIILPEATSLSAQAFRYCNSLTEVYIPKVINIANNVFDSTKFITKMTLNNQLKTHKKLKILWGAGKYDEKTETATNKMGETIDITWVD